MGFWLKPLRRLTEFFPGASRVPHSVPLFFVGLLSSLQQYSMTLIISAVRRAIIAPSAIRRAGAVVPGVDPSKQTNWQFGKETGPRAMPGFFQALYDTIQWFGPKSLWGGAIPLGFTTAMLSGCYFNNYRRNTIGYQYNKPDGEGGGGH